MKIDINKYASSLFFVLIHESMRYFIIIDSSFEQVNKIEESFDLINSKTKPLAAYLFTNKKKLKEQFVMSVPAGGLVINDTTVHVRFFSAFDFVMHIYKYYISGWHTQLLVVINYQLVILVDLGYTKGVNAYTIL